MSINLESLKGTYDKYPDEWATWKYLKDTVEETAEEFGFRHIDPPSIERQELWTEKEEDSVTDEMYAFTDKGDNEITLVPEQTPTRARLIQKRKDLKKPVKWYNTSKRWRYEDVTRGRDREFLQGDFDIFGIESVEADAEIIAAAATIYKKLGLSERVKFKINDRNILESALDYVGVTETQPVLDVIDDKEKMSRDEFLKEIKKLVIDDIKGTPVYDELKQEGYSGRELREEAALSLAKNVDEVSGRQLPMNKSCGPMNNEGPEELERRFKNFAEESDELQSQLDRLKDLRDALEAYGVAEMCEIDTSIYRGLAYYTGLVFEAFDSEGELRALFGGGRYDNLVGDFGDRDVPAVGFAFGYSTTIELLKKEERYPLKEVETDVYVLSVSESVRDVALSYATKLRDKGLSVETDLAGRGFGSQLGYADDINAEKVLIVGERDLENDEVTVKDMDSGKEENIGKDEVLEHLSSEGFFLIT